jgi:hypothetical protein
MSGIFDQIINYSPPLIVSGTVNYKGTWDASANSPTLNASPAASTKGDYYVVSTAGTQFGITFAIGDWIISNGTAWEKVDLTDAVSSVFGRTGAVVGVSTDYSAVGITNTAIGASSPSTGAFTTVSASTPIAVASGGTGVSTSTGTTNVVLSNSPTIVTPVIAQINDASGNETLKLASIASAVNEISIENAAIGNPVHIRATGGDASVGLHLVAKGASGYVNVTDGVDETKRIMFNAAGGTTNTRTMLSSTQTVDRTLTLPDATGTLLYGGGPLGTPTSGTVTNLTGTASININGTVGATTPSTGAFTTLSATSGISALGNLIALRTANNLSTSTTKESRWVGVHYNTAEEDMMVMYPFSTATENTIAYGGGASAQNAATKHDFYVAANNTTTSGTLGASISSTGLAVTGALSSTTGANFATSSGSVGIGTSSPAAPLHSYGTSGAGVVSTRLMLTDTGGSTGNGAGIDFSYFTSNIINASIYAKSVAGGGGALAFAVAASDGAASSEYMRITKAGNVGIGTTSPAANLDVRGANKLFDSHGIVNVYATDSTTVGYGGSIAFGGNNGTGGTSPYPYAKIQGIKEGSTSTWNGALVFGTTASSSAVTERMRIDSSGNLLVGTTSSAWTIGFSEFKKSQNSASALVVSNQDTGSSGSAGVVFAAYGNSWYQSIGTYAKNGNALTWALDASAATPSVKMSLDSNGLAVTGVCDVSGFFRSNGETIGNSNSPLATAFADGNTGLSLRSSGDGTSVTFASFRKANATVIGSITRVTTTDAVVYNTTSDGRLKENLRDFTDSGRLIDSLKPRVFDWKNSDENGKNVVGFIAQEEHAADPMFAHIGAVSVGDEDPETITKQWQRSDSALIPILVAELKALRQRMAAVEGK